MTRCKIEFRAADIQKFAWSFTFYQLIVRISRMKIKNILLVWIGVFAMNLSAAQIEVGTKAPTKTVLLETGKTVELEPLYSKGYVLIYFYPKADTPGCTAQACSLRDAYTQLEKKGVTIFGVSSDNVNDQKAFKEKYHLPFHLIADEKGELAKALEVPMQGTFMSRQAFLIHKGTIIWLDRKASTKEQARDVLKVLEQK